MKTLKYILSILGGILLTSGIVYAINVTVPQSTQWGQVLIGTSVGGYTPVATSTLGISSGSTGNVSTSSPDVANSVTYFTTNSATPALISGVANNSDSTQKFLSQTSSGVPSWQTLPSAGSLTYYFYGLQATSSPAYLLQEDMATTSKVSLVYSGLSASNTLQNWITPVGFPNLTFIPAGAYEFHIHASETGGMGTLSAQFWEVNSSGADIAMIGTSEVTPVLTGSEVEYRVYYVNPNTYTLANSSSRILTRVIYTRTSGMGTVTLYAGGEADSHTSLPSNTVDATNFVPYTGATKNVDLGLFNASTSQLTVSGNTYLPSISQGFSYIDSLNRINSVASSSINLSGFNNDLASLTATNGTLTFSGSYNGSTARTVGLNLGNANTWTATQAFTTIGVNRAATSGTGIIMQIDGTVTHGLSIIGSAANSLTYNSYVTGDGQIRYTQEADGTTAWGDGTNVTDTKLYRSAASTLKTDGSFIVGANLTVPTLGTAAGTFLAADGSGNVIATSTPTGTNYWTLNGNNIYNNNNGGNGFVGISTTSPWSSFAIDEPANSLMIASSSVWSGVGSYTYNYPGAVSFVVVQAWGAGGGGGSWSTVIANSGAGGAFVGSTTVAYTSGSNITIVVGQGGRGAAANSGGAGGSGKGTGGTGSGTTGNAGGGGGGSSSFGSSVIACGGGGGGNQGAPSGASGTSGGTGGPGSSSNGAGGGGACLSNGGNGSGASGGAGASDGTTATFAGTAGQANSNGGGAGGSGLSGVGGAGSGGTGGTGSGGAAAGANGSTTEGGGGGNTGSNAGSPGAGGGAAKSAQAGNGGDGRVIVTAYTYVTTTTTGTPNVSANLFSISGLYLSGINVIHVIFEFINQFGHLITGGVTPTCGTGCASVQGDDRTMRVTTNSSVTSITVNFANSWTTSPICIPTEDDTALTGTVDASTTPTTVVLTASASLTTKHIGVICQNSINFTY